MIGIVLFFVKKVFLGILLFLMMVNCLIVLILIGWVGCFFCIRVLNTNMKVIFNCIISNLNVLGGGIGMGNLEFEVVLNILFLKVVL